MPDTLENRLTQIRQRIADACLRVGRSPDEVSLLPVSKTFPGWRLREAAALGLRRFGENKAQELRQKAEELQDLNLDWVLIGHLQTNKAKEAARYAHEVQSLDRLSLAEALDTRLQQAGRSIDVLVQVKTSPEPSKFGIAPSEVLSFLNAIRSLDTLRVKGLMTLAVNSVDPIAVRSCFSALRELREQLRQAGFDQLSTLSMGMSGDFEQAIEEGSTEVRIGSALFGLRDYATGA